MRPSIPSTLIAALWLSASASRGVVSASIPALNEKNLDEIPDIPIKRIGSMSHRNLAGLFSESSTASACNACDPDDQPNSKCKGRCGAMNTVCRQEDVGGCTVLQELFSEVACTCATTSTTTTTTTPLTTTTTTTSTSLTTTTKTTLTPLTTTSTTPLPTVCCDCGDCGYQVLAPADCTDNGSQGDVCDYCSGAFGGEVDASNCELTTTTPLPPVCCDCGDCGYKVLAPAECTDNGSQGDVCDYCSGAFGGEVDASNCELTTTTTTTLLPPVCCDCGDCGYKVLTPSECTDNGSQGDVCDYCSGAFGGEVDASNCELTTTTTTTPLPPVCCDCGDCGYKVLAPAECTDNGSQGDVCDYCSGAFGGEVDASNCELTTTTTTTPLPTECCDCGRCGYKAGLAPADCSDEIDAVCDYCAGPLGGQVDASYCELTTTSSTITDY